MLVNKLLLWCLVLTKFAFVAANHEKANGLVQLIKSEIRVHTLPSCYNEPPMQVCDILLTRNDHYFDARTCQPTRNKWTQNKCVEKQFSVWLKSFYFPIGANDTQFFRQLLFDHGFKGKDDDISPLDRYGVTHSIHLLCADSWHEICDIVIGYFWLGTMLSFTLSSVLCSRFVQ